LRGEGGLDFGLLTAFASPPWVSDAAAFVSLGQMRAAEDMGYDAVWLAEIHFQKDRSVLASPLVIAAALAACTRRLKIGIAVQVRPLSHPCVCIRRSATRRRRPRRTPDGTARALPARVGPHRLALGPQAPPADLPCGMERVGSRRARRLRREHAALRGGDRAAGPRGARGEHGGVSSSRSARR